MSMKLFAFVWDAHQPYLGLGALGMWARRLRHGVAVRPVPDRNKTNRTVPDRRSMDEEDQRQHWFPSTSAEVLWLATSMQTFGTAESGACKKKQLLRLPSRIRSKFLMCVHDFDFVMDAYNIYMLQIPLNDCHAYNEANRPSDNVTPWLVKFAAQ
jgi:hypothetical protein